MKRNGKLIQIIPKFARSKEIPSWFVATKLKETERAIYLYGHGTTETTREGVCAICGRRLTHPVSVLLGVGPECGSHFHDWDAVGGYTTENIERLKLSIQEIKIDTWVPKSCVLEIKDAENPEIEIPEDHPMINDKKTNTKKPRMARMVYYKNGDPAVKIIFPFDRDDITKVKTLSGRNYHSGPPKFWTAPLSVDTVQSLKDWGFELDNELKTFLENSKINIEELELDLSDRPILKGKLFPFQEKGVAFVEKRKGRALIGDEMGLGKTVQSIAWMHMHPEVRPVVIITPANVKYQWAEMMKDWMTDPDIQILSGTKPYKLTGSYILINYDIVDSWKKTLKEYNPALIITDECHYYKNSRAKRTKAIKYLAKGTPHFIALSGTPAVNRPIELFNAINIIDRTIFPDFWGYAQKYCGAVHNGYGWDFNGASNIAELNKKLTTTIMIRRTKKEVLKELPDKIYSFIPMELSEEEEYTKAENNFLSWVRENKGNIAARKAENAIALTQIATLKQLAAKGKLPQAISWIEDFFSQSSDKLVVFCEHTFAVDALMEKFKDIAVKIDGSIPQNKRYEIVQEFQNNEKVKLFVGNLKAASEGITLTASSNVAFLELPWTPGALDQAADRCHRIGQENTVNIHYILAKDTIEEEMARIIDEKRKVLKMILDGKEAKEEELIQTAMSKANESVFEEIINHYSTHKGGKQQ